MQNETTRHRRDEREREERERGEREREKKNEGVCVRPIFFFFSFIYIERETLLFQKTDDMGHSLWIVPYIDL